MALLRRIQETGRLAEALETEIKRRGFHERTLAALLDAAYGHRVRNATYRKAADVSDAVSSRDLGALSNAGLLVPQGAKRGRFYLAGERVRQLRAETDMAKLQTDPFSGHQERVVRPGYAPNTGATHE